MFFASESQSRPGGDEAAEQPWNCLNCRRRKVRCDRCHPCSSCVKGQRDCVFPTAGRMQRRSERGPLSSEPKSRQTELVDRIRRLESMVETLNSELEGQQAKPDSPPRKPAQGPLQSRRDSGSLEHPQAASYRSSGDATIRTIQEPASQRRKDSGPQPSPSVARIMISEERGRLYIGDRFWASLRQEIKLVRESFELQKDEPDQDSSFPPALLLSHKNSNVNNSSFVFRMKCNEDAATRLDDLRPLPSQMLFIWQTFHEYVAPIVAVLHAPTVTKMIHDCKGRIETLGPTVEPLMFAISTAAINSLSEEEVRVTFNRNKEDFIAQLRLGTERALIRADFITTSSLSVVQAAVIHIFVLLRDESSRYTWSLMGLLMRIAISMGLHRDGTFFPDMPPLVVEMRRRIWWFLCFLETRCWNSLGNSEIAGIGVAERKFDTREPLNINDDDIDATMTEFPLPRTGYTDSTMTLMRCDIWRLFQTTKSMIARIGTPRQEASDENIRKMLETLRNFKEIWSKKFNLEDNHHPSLVVVGYMCKIHANSLELVAGLYRRPHSPGDGPDDQAFAAAWSLLKDFHTLTHQKGTERVNWLVRGQVHWQPLAIVLSHIGSRPWDDSSEEAWRVVRELLSDVSEAVQADTLWQPLYRLATRAQNNRSRTLGTLEKPQESAECTTEQLPSPMMDYTHILAPLSKFPLETTPMTGVSPSMNAASRGGYKNGHGSRDADMQPLESAGQQVDGGTEPSLFPGGLEKKQSDSGDNSGDAMNITDGALENMEWEDWNEILRTNGQSLLWGLGAI